MSFETFYRRFRRNFRDRYPSCTDAAEKFDFEHLISPYVIQLPQTVYDRAQEAIRTFWNISRSEDYRREIPALYPWLRDLKGTGASVLMAYDFHSTPDGRVYLVEINTNGAGFLLADLTYRAHELQAKPVSDPLISLRESFFNEAAAWGKRKVKNALIIDESPGQQKMFVEFLMYKELFENWGWHAEISDSGIAAAHDTDLIYNRLTDFYLQDPKHEWLLKSYLADDVCLTPNPKEYWLLGDKERLSDSAKANGWNQPAIQNVLIPTYELDHFGGPEALWAERKNLFFKPRRSFGSKAVYRGASVSRKVFERILTEDYIVQGFVPAQSWNVSELNSHMENWKFDLRFFVYRDQIQLGIARSYQGQVTNFSSQFGGWTAIDFKN